MRDPLKFVILAIDELIICNKLYIINSKRIKYFEIPSFSSLFLIDVLSLSFMLFDVPLLIDASEDICDKGNNVILEACN